MIDLKKNFIFRTYINLRKENGKKNFQESYDLNLKKCEYVKHLLLTYHYKKNSSNQIIINLFSPEKEIITKKINVSEIPNVIKNFDFDTNYYSLFLFNNDPIFGENYSMIFEETLSAKDFIYKLNNLFNEIHCDLFVEFITEKNEYFKSKIINRPMLNMSDLIMNLDTKISYSQIVSFNDNIRFFKINF
jgi:hypothetical protein